MHSQASPPSPFLEGPLADQRGYFFSLFLDEPSDDFPELSDFPAASAVPELAAFCESSDFALSSFLAEESPFEALEEEPAEDFLA